MNHATGRDACDDDAVRGILSKIARVARGDDDQAFALTEIIFFSDSGLVKDGLEGQGADLTANDSGKAAADGGFDLLCSHEDTDVLLGAYDKSLTLSIMDHIAAFANEIEERTFRAETIAALDPGALGHVVSGLEDLNRDHDGSRRPRNASAISDARAVRNTPSIWKSHNAGREAL